MSVYIYFLGGGGRRVVGGIGLLGTWAVPCGNVCLLSWHLLCLCRECLHLELDSSFGYDNVTPDRRQSKTLILSTNVDNK